MKASDVGAVTPPGRDELLKLIEYVRKLAELSDRPVWTLASYRNLVLHEKALQGRIGIRHDMVDEDGRIYLQVDRLSRTDPPVPPELAKDWLTVWKDPTKPPAIQSLRSVSLPVEEADRLIADGIVLREDVSATLKPTPGEERCDVILRIDRFPDVKMAIETYLREKWSIWSAQETPRRETIDIYDRLFSLHQTLKLEGSEKPLELVWGMGVARWLRPPDELDHPIVEQLVELELNEDGALLIRPRSADPILAVKPFIAAEVAGVDLVIKFARDFLEKLPPDDELSPFNKKTFTPILRNACTELDASGVYHPDHITPDDRTVPPAGPHLLITDTWVVYARARSENFFISDLGRLHNEVSSAETLPPSAQCLVLPPSNEPAYPPGGGIGMPASQPGSGGHPDDLRSSQLFFPKPFNEDQVAIAGQLDNPSVEGLVVQGPPGTGKTHTIANIICHYLATGRRVLVTSKSEGALAVLRDQIPEGIRDLAISLLTSEREGLKQLEVTVNMLASKISSLDSRAVERDIRDGEYRIGELDRRIASIDAEILSFAKKHLQRVGAKGAGDGELPIELARRVVQNRGRYLWFLDRPERSQEPHFTSVDIADARSARKLLGPDLAYLRANLPSASDLPDTASIAAIHRDLANAKRIEREQTSDAPLLSDLEPNALQRADLLLRSISAHAEVLELCAASSWLSRLYNDWCKHGIDAESARPLAQLFATLTPVVEKRTAIAAHGVELPHDAHADQVVVEAIRRAAAGQRPFGVLPIGKSAARGVVDSIRILGHSPQGPEAWAKVVTVISWQAALAAVCVRWRALALAYELPDIPDKTTEALRRLEEFLSKVAAVSDAVRTHIPGDNFYSAAVERDPSLFEDAVGQRVIIATPATLIALAKAIAFGWRQEKVAENALRVHTLGRELYKRLTTMVEHIGECGDALRKSVKHFNHFVGSLEQSVMPQARKFNELEVEGTSSPIKPLEVLDSEPRQLRADRDFSSDQPKAEA